MWIKTDIGLLINMDLVKKIEIGTFDGNWVLGADNGKDNFIIARFETEDQAKICLDNLLNKLNSDEFEMEVH